MESKTETTKKSERDFCVQLQLLQSTHTRKRTRTCARRIGACTGQKVPMRWTVGFYSTVSDVWRKRADFGHNDQISRESTERKEYFDEQFTALIAKSAFKPQLWEVLNEKKTNVKFLEQYHFLSFRIESVWAFQTSCIVCTGKRCRWCWYCEHGWLVENMCKILFGSKTYIYTHTNKQQQKSVCMNDDSKVFIICTLEFKNTPHVHSEDDDYVDGEKNPWV